MEKKEMQPGGTGFNFAHGLNAGASDENNSLGKLGRHCYKEWDTQEVSFWLQTQIKLP